MLSKTELEKLKKLVKTYPNLEKIAKLDQARRDTVTKRRILINEIDSYFKEKIPKEMRTFEFEE